jgi:hypothetical protein
VTGTGSGHKAAAADPKSRTIILAIRARPELWFRVTEAWAEGSKGFWWFMLAAGRRFRAQNTSPEKAVARTARERQITWLAGHFM